VNTLNQQDIINDITNKTKDDNILDIMLTVNGHELNFESFVKRWQKQVHELIAKEAKDLVEEKFAYISDLVYELTERIKPEIDKRLEDWEKDQEGML
jgi:hypothetical protein